jgi:excisionase family DNA binding protein
VSERLLTPAEVAERVGLSTKAVRRAYERGELPASKLCGRVRIRPEDVEAWIEGNRIEPVSFPPPDRPLTLPAPNGLRALL